ncbi:uncharacterized protein VTP21DRAFT_10566 [Calcarisporiella thermophila]|uniref:uncharacterized protein n=1 Tax=Calcarisporiella thermophila TaxID=911321 RepID=UPI003744481C
MSDSNIEDGATNNELLLSACRNDQEDMLEDIFQQPGSYDINFQDGAGNTALHYACQFGSQACVEILLDQENINLNIQNRLEGDTPLHKAVAFTDDPDVAYEIVQMLIDAGADLNILNRNRQSAENVAEDEEVRKLIRKAKMASLVDSRDLVAEDDDDDDSDDAPSDDE